MKLRIFRSEPYIVYDAIFYDPTTSSSLSRYYINGSGGTTITYSDGYYNLIIGSTGQYLRIHNNQINISDYQGKKIHFEAFLETTNGKASLSFYDDRTGSAQIRATGNEVSSGISSLEVEIPSNVSTVIFQIAPYIGMSSGDTIKIKEIKVYIV